MGRFTSHLLSRGVTGDPIDITQAELLPEGVHPEFDSLRRLLDYVRGLQGPVELFVTAERESWPRALRMRIVITPQLAADHGECLKVLTSALMELAKHLPPPLIVM